MGQIAQVADDAVVHQQQVTRVPGIFTPGKAPASAQLAIVRSRGHYLPKTLCGFALRPGGDTGDI